MSTQSPRVPSAVSTSVEEARAAVRQALQTKDQEGLDELVFAVELEWGIFGTQEQYTLEAILKEEVVKLTHELQHWWLQEQCPCGGPHR